MPRLPLAAILLGVAGLVPFAACALFAVTTRDQTASFWLSALIFYGAIVLSFVGAMHWGFAMAPRLGLDGLPADPVRPRLRLGLSVLPALIGWAALLTTLVLPPVTALAVLIAGFILTVVTESRLAREDLLPTGYMLWRSLLSVITILILGAVLFLRLSGILIVPS